MQNNIYQLYRQKASKIGKYTYNTYPHIDLFQFIDVENGNIAKGFTPQTKGSLPKKPDCLALESPKSNFVFTPYSKFHIFSYLFDHKSQPSQL